MALKINLDAFDNLKQESDQQEKNVFIKKTEKEKEHKNLNNSLDLLNVINSKNKELKKYKTFYLPINIINKLEQIAKLKNTSEVNIIIDLINFIKI